MEEKIIEVEEKISLSNNMSFLSLILEASFFVQLIMLLLLIASFVTWWIIFYKNNELKAIHRNMTNFINHFWNSKDKVDLYQKIQNKKSRNIAEDIFLSGVTEFGQLRTDDKFSKVQKLENINRAIESSLTLSSTKLETKLTILSNIGSVSPYVGLLGTVWGIMNAFRGLSTVGQATLSQVAPGIAEALIATALGLFAAIPAVLAYNIFTNSIEKIISECESFSQDFINYLSKQN